MTDPPSPTDQQDRTVLSLLQLDPSTQPIMFGQGMSLQRFDRPKYKQFLQLFDKQRAFFWGPERFDLTNDRADFERLTEPEQFIFIKNLQYQTLMDSVIGGGIDALKAAVSLPEVKVCFDAWEFFEGIHSLSYTYILKGVLPERIREVFDTTLQDEEIVKRAMSVRAEYDRLLNSVAGDKKKETLLALAATQILEGVRFYLSFACSFSFAEPPSARMVANAQILKEICRDENLHVEITANLLNIFRTVESEGFTEAWKECEPEIIEMFRKAADEEKSWADYLMSKGSVFGLSAEALKGYVEWLVDRRMKSIGLKPLYNRKNPIGTWMDKWLGAAQVAPQEVAVESYRVASVDNDLRSNANVGGSLADLLA